MIGFIAIEAYPDPIGVIGYFRPEKGTVCGYPDLEAHASESVTDLGQGFYQEGFPAGNVHPFDFSCLIGQGLNAFFNVDWGFDVESAASRASKIAVIGDWKKYMVHIFKLTNGNRIRKESCIFLRL
jgi:hypothetical protein